MKYTYDKKSCLNSLFADGFAYLPSISNLLQELGTAKKTLREANSKTYSTDLEAHRELVEKMDLAPFFEGALSKFCELGFSVREDDQYFVTRIVKPGQSSEAYRGHFDAHLLTVVLPVQIPKTAQLSCGELKFCANARKKKYNELTNFYQKLYWKKYASEEGFNKLADKRNVVTENFEEMRPLAFIGTTTFHGNNVLDESLDERVSCLCHLYDPSPKYGISNVLRIIRNR